MTSPGTMNAVQFRTTTRVGRSGSRATPSPIDARLSSDLKAAGALMQKNHPNAPVPDFISSASTPRSARPMFRDNTV